MSLDSEAKQQIVDDWMEVLKQLWSSIGKDAEQDAARLTVYARQLGRVPLGLLERAVDRAIASNGKYLVVPTVGSVWEAVRKEAGIQPHEDVYEAMNRWTDTNFEKCVVRFG